MSQEVFLCQFLLTAPREKKHCNKYSVTSSLHVIRVIVFLASHLESRCCVTNIELLPRHMSRVSPGRGNKTLRFPVTKLSMSDKRVEIVLDTVENEENNIENVMSDEHFKRR